MFPRWKRPAKRRLRRVARACEDYGVRVQKSVFECQVGQTEWVQLARPLLREIKPEEDSLRFYYLDETAVQRIEHHGVDKPIGPERTADRMNPASANLSDGPATGISRLRATQMNGTDIFHRSLTYLI
jgi:CRISPR-associated protein Cas2